MSTISTHVLDTARGLPAPGVPVDPLQISTESLGSGTTDEDGRISRPSPPDGMEPGTYQLRFDTAA